MDFFMIVACSILGLMAHGSVAKRWLEWVLRGLIGLFCFSESFVAMAPTIGAEPVTVWARNILYALSGMTGLDLLKQFRQLLSVVLTAVEFIVGGQLLLSLIRRKPIQFFADRMFIPESVPHLVAMFVYIQTMAWLLLVTNPQDAEFPSINIPIPLPLMDMISQLLSYNGLGMVALAFCGVGVYVTRTPMACLDRLGWKKPTGGQIGLGVLLIFGSFFYDYLWSILAHNMHQDLGAKLTMFNSGTFQVAGGLTASIILALFTAVCAGVGEETIMRGAIQPAFGIVPAGIMHGVLHGQFAHAPFFMVQVAVWSCLMGIVRKYTNTTTTIIGHAGFNFVTTLLFAFNP